MIEVSVCISQDWHRAISSSLDQFVALPLILITNTMKERKLETQTMDECDVKLCGNEVYIDNFKKLAVGRIFEFF